LNNQNKKTLKDLHLTDRFLFDEAMEDLVIRENILKVILGKEAEKEQSRSDFLRSVKLDLFAIEDEDNDVNEEILQEKEAGLVRRSRYKQAQLDRSLLVIGEDLISDLIDSYMISIMPFDLFGSQKFRYICKMGCIDVPDLILEDGSTRIFINTYGKNNEDETPEFIELMHYINETREEAANKFQSPRVKDIHKRLERIRSNKEVEDRWMSHTQSK